jgi:hypothetical protein
MPFPTLAQALAFYNSERYYPRWKEKGTEARRDSIFDTGFALKLRRDQKGGGKGRCGLFFLPERYG